MRILYIEDDAVDVLAMKRLAGKTKDIVISTCDSLERARELLQLESFDIIISDLSLSDASTDDVINFIHTQQTTTYLLSGADDLNDIEQQKYIAGVFQKPVNSEILNCITQRQFNTEVEGESAEKYLKYTYEVCEEDEDCQLELITTFLTTAKEDLQQLETDLITEDPQTISKTVHKLKSKLSFVGLNKEWELAGKVEVTLRSEEKTVKEVRGELDQLSTQLQVAVEQLDIYLAQKWKK